MNIGDFFVKLGVKDGEKAASQIEGVRDKMKGLGEMSLQTKVAMAGVIFGIKEMVSNSAAIGSSLSKFSIYTGQSAKALQEYQYAARQVGVTNDEVTSSISGIQDAMARARYFGEAPAGLAELANLTGGFDFAKGVEDPFYVVQKLQQLLSQSSVPVGIQNLIAESFGLSDDMVQALRRGAFNPDAMKEAITYTDQEIKNLERVDVMWSNISDKIEKAYGKFFATGEGRDFVGQIGSITESIIELTSSLLKLADQLEVFKAINSIIQGLQTWSDIGTTTTKRTGRTLEVLKSGQYNRTQPNWIEENFPPARIFMETMSNIMGELNNPRPSGPAPRPQSRTPQSIDVNQNFTFMGGGEENVGNVSRSFENGIMEAYRQLPQSEAN